MKKVVSLLIAVLFCFSVSSIAEEPDPALIGKWSFYYDITQQIPEIQEVMSSSLVVYDLYLFKDGSAYMTSMDVSKKTEKPDFSFGALSGVWLGSADSFMIRIGFQTYKSSLQDEFLYLYMTQSLPLAFVKVDCTDKMIELSY